VTRLTKRRYSAMFFRLLLRIVLLRNSREAMLLLHQQAIRIGELTLTLAMSVNDAATGESAVTPE